MRYFNSLVSVLLSVLIITSGGCKRSICDKLLRSNVGQSKVELINEFLSTLDEKGELNGVVLVSENSQVIYKKGFGYANYEEKKSHTVQSCFRLASVSKQFAAMAIMILSERGKLAYDDDIRKYLPSLPYEGVTIRHLLVHTSGLPDYMVLFDDKWDDKEKLVYKEDVLRLFGEYHPPVDFAPGEKYEYSNTGYCLLACIVESASGERFDVFMQKNIFGPLEMQNTVLATGAKDQPIKNRAFGYSSSFENTDYHYINGVVGDGGIYSTVDDVFKWDQGLYNAGLVNKSTMAEALTPYKLNDGTTGDYGFGWGLYRGDKRDVIEHSGSWAGFRTLIRRDLKNRNSIIILTNNSRGVGDIKSCIDKILLSGCGAEDVRQAGILFEDATVIDGSGAGRQIQDVLVVDGVIGQMGDIPAVAGDRCIDAEGLILAPGFIDTHSHHNRGLTEHPDATAVVSQGVTTIVVGQCGGSMKIDELKQSLVTVPAAVNVASYAGHGSIRTAVMGADFKRKATSQEVAAMASLLEKEMAAGALGLSTGLEYDPGIYCDTEEVVALAKVAAKYGGRYASHVRSEDRYFLQAIEELLSIGRQANIPVQISHLKIAITDLWGKADRILEKLEAGRKEGIDVSADIYPYTYWESTLTVLFPERDFDDLDEAKYVLDKISPADGLTLTSYGADARLVGKTVAEIAAERKKPEAETLLQLIHDAYKGKPGESDFMSSQESVVGVSMTESDIATFMSWEHSNICSDGSIDGHPRGYGAFARAISRYVKEKGVVSLEEMIHKMTALSASHTGIKNRGLIKSGYAADLVLFDYERIKDNSSIEDNDALASGIVGVWVNGERVWEKGGPTGIYPGVFIERSSGVIYAEASGARQ
jgi:N-acyl-D-aspartate/D-glutamate deacylase